MAARPTVYRVIHELRRARGFVDNSLDPTVVMHAGARDRPMPAGQARRRSACRTAAFLERDLLGGPDAFDRLADDAGCHRRRARQGEQERGAGVRHARDDEVAAHRAGQVAAMGRPSPVPVIRSWPAIR